MNAPHTLSDPLIQERLEARLGARLAGMLSSSLDELPPDVQTRLRFAREQALQRRTEPEIVGRSAGGAAVLGRLSPWWPRLGALLPVAVLALGALLVDQHREREAVAVAAQIDSALLADELPPQAYADPGFVAFLKLQQP